MKKKNNLVGVLGSAGVMTVAVAVAMIVPTRPLIGAGAGAGSSSVDHTETRSGSWSDVTNTAFSSVVNGCGYPNIGTTYTLTANAGTVVSYVLAEQGTHAGKTLGGTSVLSQEARSFWYQPGNHTLNLGDGGGVTSRTYLYNNGTNGEYDEVTATAYECSMSHRVMALNGSGLPDWSYAKNLVTLTCSKTNGIHHFTLEASGYLSDFTAVGFALFANPSEPGGPARWIRPIASTVVRWNRLFWKDHQTGGSYFNNCGFNAAQDEEF